MTGAQQRSWIVFGACAMALASARVGAAQTRDAALASRLEPAGTSAIAGTVISDETPPRPMRRVIVTLTEAASVILSRVVTTDETGRFAFRNLPAGRYSITASRPPFLAGAYGVRRIAGPGSVQSGTVIIVAAGQQVTDSDVTMMRSSVITGVVRDVDGEPARAFTVTISYFQYSAATGERTLAAYGRGFTDDRGAYRIYGLPPGTYVVSATGPASGGWITTDADVRRAMDAIERPGTTSFASSPAASGQPARRPMVGYVPVFYPGTLSALQAAPVTLGVGEERGGVDLQMQFAQQANVQGTVTGLDGRPAVAARVAISAQTAGQAQMGPTTRSAAQTDSQGQFTMSGLSPGTYTIEAWPMTGVPEGAPTPWAISEVTIQGDTIVNLALQAGVTVTGRIVFQPGSTTPPADLSKARVQLMRATTASSGGAAGTIKATGEFSITGVIPGRHRLSASLVLPSIETGWYLKSATINGQDAMDVPVEIRPGENVSDAVITMTDRPTEIAGTMTDASNRPAPEYFVIVFAADQAQWLPGTRRIMHTRPSHDGTFAFRNLPPGAYRIAAVTDIQQGEWFDPAFLTQLVEASVAVTLPEYGKVRQDLRIR